MRSLTRAPSSVWRILDALFVRQLAEDLAYIETHGRPDEFASFVIDQLRAEYGDDAHDAAAHCRYAMFPLPGETLGQRVLPGIDDRALGDVLAWHHHRRRLRLVAGIIRDEASRIRAESSRREGRR